MQLGLFVQPLPLSNCESVTSALRVVTENASQAIPAAKKKQLSQYFTSISIAKQMANMVLQEDIRDVGDHGAGTGILSSTLIAVKQSSSSSPFNVSAYEIDKDLHPIINGNFDLLNAHITDHELGGVTGCVNDDFMTIANDVLSLNRTPSLDAIVLNPPYKKLNQKSDLALLFKEHGVSVPNVYAAFIVLSILMLRDGGELVAIVPRSFCNGDYYASFRSWLVSQGSIDWFVRYKRRSNCFKGDNVLQENLIFRFTKAKVQDSVIRVSLCDNPEEEPSFEGLLPFTDVIDPFSGAFHIPSNNSELDAIHAMAEKPSSFQDKGLVVNTGKLEVNRMVEHLSSTMTGSLQASVVYSQHWNNDELKMKWNDEVGKDCYLNINSFTQKKCIPSGRYILIKRISANDDRAGRCHPCLVGPDDIPGDLWAIDNHVQVVSIPDQMSDTDILQILDSMKSQTTNHFFRVISGTTQLNCNDIRKLRF